MMMSIDKLARSMGETMNGLRERPFNPGKAREREAARRKFVAVAFRNGDPPEMIAAYLNRSDTMVLHALRMICLDQCGGEYGRSLAEINWVLRGQGAA